MRRRAKSVAKELLKRYEPLLWSWPLQFRKNREAYPKEASVLYEKLVHGTYGARGTLGVMGLGLTAAWLYLTDDEAKKSRNSLSSCGNVDEDRSFGYELEDKYGDGKLEDRRYRFEICLGFIAGRGIDIEIVCRSLAKAKWKALNDKSFSLGTREHQDSINKAKATLKEIQEKVINLLNSKHRGHMSPRLDRHLESLPGYITQELEEDWCEFTNNSRGHWRRIAEKKLSELGVVDDDRRELYSLMGLSSVR